MYIIARCPSCGKVMMANTANKTRSCPSCGRRHEVSGLRTLARAGTSREALALIQSLKEQQGGPGGEPRFKRFRA